MAASRRSHVTCMTLQYTEKQANERVNEILLYFCKCIEDEQWKANDWVSTVGLKCYLLGCNSSKILVNEFLNPLMQQLYILWRCCCFKRKNTEHHLEQGTKWLSSIQHFVAEARIQYLTKMTHKTKAKHENVLINENINYNKDHVERTRIIWNYSRNMIDVISDEETGLFLQDFVHNIKALCEGCRRVLGLRSGWQIPK